MMHAVISLLDARQSGLARFYTGAPCARGHLAQRYVCSRKCVVCQQLNRDQCRARNLDKYREYCRAYYHRNSEAYKTKKTEAYATMRASKIAIETLAKEGIQL